MGKNERIKKQQQKEQEQIKQRTQQRRQKAEKARVNKSPTPVDGFSMSSVSSPEHESQNRRRKNAGKLETSGIQIRRSTEAPPNKDKTAAIGYECEVDGRGLESSKRQGFRKHATKNSSEQIKTQADAENFGNAQLSSLDTASRVQDNAESVLPSVSVYRQNEQTKFSAETSKADAEERPEFSGALLGSLHNTCRLNVIAKHPSTDSKSYKDTGALTEKQQKQTSARDENKDPSVEVLTSSPLNNAFDNLHTDDDVTGSDYGGTSTTSKAERSEEEEMSQERHAQYPCVHECTDQSDINSNENPEFPQEQMNHHQEMRDIIKTRFHVQENSSEITECLLERNEENMRQTTNKYEHNDLTDDRNEKLVSIECQDPRRGKESETQTVDTLEHLRDTSLESVKLNLAMEIKIQALDTIEPHTERINSKAFHHRNESTILDMNIESPQRNTWTEKDELDGQAETDCSESLQAAGMRDGSVTEPHQVAEMTDGLVSEPLVAPEIPNGSDTEPLQVAEMTDRSDTEPLQVAEMTDGSVTEPLQAADMTDRSVTEPLQVAEMTDGSVTEPLQAAEMRNGSVTELLQAASTRNGPVTEPLQAMRDGSATETLQAPEMTYGSSIEPQTTLSRALSTVHKNDSPSGALCTKTFPIGYEKCRTPTFLKTSESMTNKYQISVNRKLNFCSIHQQKFDENPKGSFPCLNCISTSGQEGETSEAWTSMLDLENIKQNMEEEIKKMNMELERSNKDLETIKTEVETARKELDGKSQDLIKTKNDRDKIKEELEDTKENLEKTKKALLAAKQDQEFNKSVIKEKQLDLTTMEKKLERAKNELRTVSQELETTKKNLEEKTESLVATGQELDALKQKEHELKLAEKEIVARNCDLVKAQLALQAANKTLDSTRAELQRAVQDLQIKDKKLAETMNGHLETAFRLQMTKDQLDLKTNELKETTKKLEAASHDRDLLNRAKSSLENDLLATRQELESVQKNRDQDIQTLKELQDSSQSLREALNLSQESCNEKSNQIQAMTDEYSAALQEVVEYKLKNEGLQGTVITLQSDLQERETRINGLLRVTAGTDMEAIEKLEQTLKQVSRERELKTAELEDVERHLVEKTLVIQEMKAQLQKGSEAARRDQEELESLNVMKTTLEEKLTESERVISGLARFTGKVKVLEDENASLNRSIENHQCELSKLTEALHSREEEIQNKTKRLLSVKQKLDLAQNRCREKEKKITEIEKERVDLIRIVEELKSAGRHSDNHITDLTIETTNLKQDVLRLSQNLNQMKKKYEEELEEIRGANRVAEEKLRENNITMRALNRSAEKADKYKEEKDDLRKRLEETQKELDNLRLSYVQKDEKTKGLEKEAEEKRKEQEDLMSRLREKSETAYSMSLQIADLKQTVEKLQTEVASKQQTSLLNEEAIRGVEAAAAKQLRQKDQVIAGLSRAVAKEAEVSRKNGFLKQSIECLQRDLQMKEQLCLENERKQAEQEEKLRQLNQSNCENRRIRVQQEAENERLKEQVHQTEGLRAQLQQQLSLVADFQTRNKVLQDELQVKTSHLELSKNNISGMNSAFTRISKLMNEKEEQANKMQQEISHLKGINEKLIADNERYYKLNEQTLPLKHEAAALKGRTEILEKIRVDMERQLKDARESLHEKERAVVRLEVENMTLRSAYTQMSSLRGT